MLEDIRKNYRGKVRINGNEYSFCTASEKDIDQIDAMYRSIAVNYNNFDQKLDPECAVNFSETGGMFVVLSRDEIRREIAGEENLWAVIKDNYDNVLGSFWFSEKNGYFNGSEYEWLENVIFPREIVVSKTFNNKYIGRLLYYTVIYSMEQGGYTQGICDIYKVVKYKAGDMEKEVSLVNKPSRRLLESIGAEYKGTDKIRKITLDRLTVWIEPQIYYLNSKYIIERCNKFFSEKNIEIVWR